MYFLATAGSPLGLARKSRSVFCFRPPASSKPGMPGGIQPLAMSPRTAPPRVRRRALRSDAAMIALRTLRLSNGLIVVFSAM